MEIGEPVKLLMCRLRSSPLKSVLPHLVLLILSWFFFSLRLLLLLLLFATNFCVKLTTDMTLSFIFLKLITSVAIYLNTDVRHFINSNEVKIFHINTVIYTYYWISTKFHCFLSLSFCLCFPFPLWDSSNCQYTLCCVTNEEIANENRHQIEFLGLRSALLCNSNYQHNLMNGNQV